MLRTRSIILVILICLAIFGLGAQVTKAERCDEAAEVTVIIRDAKKQFIPDARFTIYEQLFDVDDNKTIGDSIGSGKIDPYIGSGTVKVYPDTDVEYYVLKVDNPSVGAMPFWFLEAMYLTCGKKTTVTQYLGGLEITVTNAVGELEKDRRVYVYKQGKDALGQPIIADQLDSFNTDNEGQISIYLPSHHYMLGDPLEYYALGFKNDDSEVFYKYYVNALDKQFKEINYAFSDLLVTLKDTNTNEPVPNVALYLYKQTTDAYGEYDLDKSLDTLKTDNEGQTYIQYPPGTYVLQYRHADGTRTNFTNIVIPEQSRTIKTLWLGAEGKDTGKCDIKSTLNLSFRDANGQALSDLQVALYEQTTDNDGSSIQGSRIGRETMDEDSLGYIRFTPSPAKRYVVEVCDEITKFGCFNFKDVEFECSEELLFEKQLNQVNIILRESNRDLKLGHKFKIYSRITDVDGKQIIDATKGYGSFKIPDQGIFTFFLADQSIKNKTLDYMIEVDSDTGFELFDNFNIEGALTHLEYIVEADKLIRIYPPADPLVNNVLGKILLQVEEHGEAWYVNPADKKRYYLGRPEDAFEVMKKLSSGISNNNLSQLPVGLEVLPTGVDTDNDGLVDVLEKGLLTNWQKTDSDDDGYNDFTEVSGDYNPLGSGKQYHNWNFARQQAGRIFLQVEGNGEAWYIYPNDYRRYYLSRPKDAFAIMRELGLGITNADLNKIAVGQIN